MKKSWGLFKKKKDFAEIWKALLFCLIKEKHKTKKTKPSNKKS